MYSDHAWYNDYLTDWHTAKDENEAVSIDNGVQLCSDS